LDPEGCPLVASEEGIKLDRTQVWVLVKHALSSRIPSAQIPNLSCADPKRRFGVDADAYSASNQPRHPNAEGATSLKEMYMLWTVFVVLLLLWILGFSFHIAGSLIHLVLVIAVVVLIIQLITGRRAL
jgi:Family of unknown function (DUF5670)